MLIKIFQNFILATLLFFLLGVNIPACANDTKPHPVVITTDMGEDDIMALLYLLKKTSVDVQAIIVDDNASVDCVYGYKHLKSILKLVNKNNIPIACGTPQALGEGHRFPKSIQQNLNQLSTITFPKVTLSNVRRDGIDLIIHTLQQSPKAMTVLTLGSLTNLALALKRNPSIQSKIANVFIMGGAVAVPGNIKDVDPHAINAVAEWNVYYDPVAAAKVFSSGLPLYLISLDATSRAPMTMDFYNNLLKSAHSESSIMVAELLVTFKDSILQHTLYFWDPLAAVIMSDPSICTWKKLPISVILSPQNVQGGLKVDLHAKMVDLCLNPNVNRFQQLFLEEIKS